MKSNELRIGNYYNQFGNIHQISVTGIAELEKAPESQLWCKPIPITEQWLIDFGFEMRESSSCKAFYIGQNELTKDWLFDLVWLDKPELINAPNAPFYRNGRHTIYYVHQLQNLYFALVGEELTKLKPLTAD